jgi:glycine/D-amino acid oxidase-like deaminating enzyme
MRIAIVGAGVAGALLAWRLRQQAPGLRLEIFAGGRRHDADASGASGGLVRGFEVGPAACQHAAESLAEIRGSATLRDWSLYRETGSVYLIPRAIDPSESLAAVERMLPGSATLVSWRRLARGYPFRGLPAGTVGVRERQAGYLSPRSLRAAVLAGLTAAGVPVWPMDVRAVTPDPAVRAASGATFRYDMVVLAAGAWTPGLLRRGGLPGQRMRTKQIQYSICRADLPGLGAFVDDATGLYGRPAGPGSFLLGLPSSRWDVDPDAVTPDLALAGAVAACARRTLGVPVEPASTVASFDCYHESGDLALRACGPGSALFTFTGGSGGAAKTVVARSRAAATTLLA